MQIKAPSGVFLGEAGPLFQLGPESLLCLWIGHFISWNINFLTGLVLIG